MQKLLAFALPKFTLLSLFIKKPFLILTGVPVIAAVNVVVSFEAVAWILVVMFTGDLITGLLASFYVWKKSSPKEKWFFGKGEGFSSDKFKKMFFKLICYLSIPLLFIRFQRILMLKNFKYESFSDAEFELATIALIVFCLTEGFSIFHENLPKCGFNLWHQIKKMIGFVKEAKKEITE